MIYYVLLTLWNWIATILSINLRKLIMKIFIQNNLF